MASPFRLIHPDWLQSPPRRALPLWTRLVLAVSFVGYSATLVVVGGILFALATGYHLDVRPPHGRSVAAAPAMVYQATPASVVSQARDTVAPLPTYSMPASSEELPANSYAVADEEVPLAPIPPDPGALAEETVPAEESVASDEASPDPTDFILFDHEFVSGSDALTPEGERHLAEMVAAMAHGTLPVLVEHPHPDAPSELAEARKQTVSRFLAEHGVDTSDQTVMMSRDFSRLSMAEFSPSSGSGEENGEEATHSDAPADANAAPAPPHPVAGNAVSLKMAPQVLLHCRMVRFDTPGVAKLLAGDQPIPQPVASLLKSLIEPPSQLEPRTFEADDAKWLTEAIPGWTKEGIVQVLSSPTVVTLLGRPAELCCGGDVPIFVQTGKGQSMVAKQEYGTKLTCTPWKLGDDRIRLHVNYELSDLCDTSEADSTFTVVKRGVAAAVDVSSGNTVVLGPIGNVTTAPSDPNGAAVVFVSLETVEPGEAIAATLPETASNAASESVPLRTVGANGIPSTITERFLASVSQMDGPQIAIDMELLEIDLTAARQQIAQGEAPAALQTLLDRLSGESDPSEPAGQQALIDAIRQLGDHPAVRVVARPRLSTICGQPASYMSGNAFPVLLPGDDQEPQGRVELRHYGTRVNCATRLLPDGDLKIDLDFEQGTLTGQSDANGIPAVATVQANTSLTAHDHQTLVVGGMACRSVAASADAPPSEKTLVLLVTPQIVRIVPRAFEKAPAKPEEVATQPETGGEVTPQR